MAKTKPPKTALALAVDALDEALADHERTTRELLKLPLDSRKNIARATEAVARLAQHEETLAEKMRELGGALGEARDRQQGDSQRAEARAGEVLERKAALDKLLERLDMLGQAARAVGTLLEQLKGASDEVSVDEAIARIGDLAGLADGLATDAQAAGFEDLYRESHALRQQLHAVLSRAGQLRKHRPQA